MSANEALASRQLAETIERYATPRLALVERIRGCEPEVPPAPGTAWQPWSANEPVTS